MAIAFVQVGTGMNTVGLSVTDAFTVTAGSLLIAAFRVGALGNTITVSDNVNAGNWSQACTQQQTTDGHQAYIYYKWNAGAGATTVTIASSGSASIRGSIAEYSGAMTSGDPIDKTSTNQGTVANPADSNATATTTQANELLIGLNTNDNSTNAAWVANIGGGGTIRQTILPFQVTAISDLTVAATGAYHNMPSFTGTNSWTSLIATFKDSGVAVAAAIRPKMQQFPKTIMRR